MSINEEGLCTNLTSHLNNNLDEYEEMLELMRNSQEPRVLFDPTHPNYIGPEEIDQWFSNLGESYSRQAMEIPLSDKNAFMIKKGLVWTGELAAHSTATRRSRAARWREPLAMYQSTTTDNHAVKFFTLLSLSKLKV